MISCTEFIPAYSEMFKYLEERGGREAVEAFWRHLGAIYLKDLDREVAEKGLRGCFDYWAHALNEEAADFTLEIDEAEEVFRIIIHRCPSKGRLIECGHIEPYAAYCDHCDTLYRGTLEALGFSYEVDLSHCGEAKCVRVIRRPPASPHGEAWRPSFSDGSDLRSAFPAPPYRGSARRDHRLPQEGPLRQSHCLHHDP